jgi:hypothetical protein
MRPIPAISYFGADGIVSQFSGVTQLILKTYFASFDIKALLVSQYTTLVTFEIHKVNIDLTKTLGKGVHLPMLKKFILTDSNSTIH